ncbi:VCBS repeat-containing protein [Amycolatopsis minnesotensis]|uniref:VCBS repeat-containing protein n=1 Tax=Amycolatopsis minnesotensis TaxID=337894 RepID=A0ABP5DE06_9PSEU
MGTRARGIAAMTGIVAAALAATAGSASADEAPPQPSFTAQADLDGNGTPETVTITKSGDNTQDLSATIDGKTVHTSMPGNGFAGDVSPLRVADFNGDGASDLVVKYSVGANTDWFGVWDFDGTGFRQLTTPDGKALTLNEGGGLATRTGYACADVPNRELSSVAAEADDISQDPITYTGSRTTYRVQDGIATPQRTMDLKSVPSADPLVSPNPDTCG